jgi:hypothetical protein
LKRGAAMGKAACCFGIVRDAFDRRDVMFEAK